MRDLIHHNSKQTEEEIKLVYGTESTHVNDWIKVVKEVQKKDGYTLDHSERVKNHALKIAKKLGLCKESLKRLFFAALLHDIGKIHISKKILNKPGRLTREEFNEIKKHPGYGRDLLMDTPLEFTTEIIYQHHERINGSGYPRGLQENEILLEAKIIGVCDSFDAMTEERSYHKGKDLTEAYNEISSLAGVTYDKDVVKAFGEVLRENNQLKSAD